MSTIGETILKLERLQKDLDSTRSDDYELIVRDVVALVKRRVINTGTDAEGGQFSPYSRAVVPVWYFQGKEGVSANDIERLRASKGYFASYRDLREVKGRPVAYKNFSFTNKMWTGLDAYAESESNGVVTIGFTTAKDREDVLNIHHEQSEILKLSKEERTLLLTLARERLIRKFNQAGL